MFWRIWWRRFLSERRTSNQMIKLKCVVLVWSINLRPRKLNFHIPTIPQSPSPVLHTDMHIRLCKKIKINLTKFYDQCDKPFPTDPPLLNLFVCFSLVSHHDRGLKERKRTRFVYFICFLLLFPLSSGIRNKRIYGNILKREVAEHQCGIVASASGWSHWTTSSDCS